MGDILDPKAFHLVTSLVESVTGPNKEDATWISLSYDETVAQLAEMGFDIDVSSKAIQDCRSLDLATVIDHLNGIGVKAGEEIRKDAGGDEEIRKDAGGDSQPRYSRRNTSEAEGNAIRNDGLISLFQPLNGVNKGKAPLTESNEDTLSGSCKTDKEALLLSMGFSRKDVAKALESCGRDSDVNDLANYIMNMMVDLPNDSCSDYDNSWSDDTRAGDSLVAFKSESMEGALESGFIEKPTGQELSVFRSLENMGLPFSIAMASAAIKACGKDAAEDVLIDFVLRTAEEHQSAGCETSDPHEEEWQDLTKLQQLKRLGCLRFSTAACLRAIDNNGDADICELLDYLEAEEIEHKFRDEEQETTADKQGREDSPKIIPPKRRRTCSPSELEKSKDNMELSNIRNLKGFGLPGEPLVPRELSQDISSPPFFYYENVANTPKGEWENMERHLFNIRAEFVDSLNFTCCRRPRGYIHNLPLEGRVDILPKPPMTIQELIPDSASYWPKWDPRVKLNTINTKAASEFVRKKIQESLNACENGDPSLEDKKTILFWASKWNLVWVRPGVLGPLVPEEIEASLGFDSDHTRVLYSPVDRIRVLGNSFQVNTVAYHLSTLRNIFPKGIKVLSLFSGIGGAEVALHKLGISLNVVVSVEIDNKARMVVASWWKTTNQKGILVDSYHDVRDVDSKVIVELVDKFDGFDLVIGGSPCNNLSGNNRCSRVGLEGAESSAFFEFPRILKEVRRYMALR